MNIELFIAKRIIKGSTGTSNISGPIVKIAIAAIAIGLAVMIVSVAIVTGFKQEIQNKVVGFGSHIQIMSSNSRYSYETAPIDRNQPFVNTITSVDGVKHIQQFATKAGIIKAGDETQGIVLKGVAEDFNWDFFSKHLEQGNILVIIEKERTNKVLISSYISNLMKLEINSEFEAFFIDEDNKLRPRKLTVGGIYNSGLEEFDKQFVIIDIKHVQKINYWNSNQVSGFEIAIDDFKRIDEVKSNIEKHLGLAITEDGTALTVQSIKERYPQEFDWLELQDINVWVIIIIMVIVAAINMVSSLLILILERTQLIGILKALGSPNWSIRKVFLYNAAYLVAKGLFWGNLFGIGLCLIQYYFHLIPLDPSTYYINTVPVNLNLVHILLLNLGSFSIIVFLLMVPSMIISRISPIKAIQFN
ncbi:MAG: ABC transporter permease [Bacteroidales bacterium]|nr:ABC transporter permease [Bacteroidales bacterium]